MVQSRGNGYHTFRGLLQSGQYLEHGGLAGSVLTDQRNAVFLIDDVGHVLEQRRGVEFYFQSFYRYHKVNNLKLIRFSACKPEPRKGARTCKRQKPIKPDSYIAVCKGTKVVIICTTSASLSCNDSNLFRRRASAAPLPARCGGRCGSRSTSEWLSGRVWCRWSGGTGC